MLWLCIVLDLCWKYLWWIKICTYAASALLDDQNLCVKPIFVYTPLYSRSCLFIFIILMISYHIQTVWQMKALWQELASLYHKICLVGDLGAGKTTLAQGLCNTWFPDHKNVSSPTYTYSHIYGDMILHIDMYRLQTWPQCIWYGLAEQIEQYPYIIIERPKFIWEYYHQDRITLDIHIEHDFSRTVYMSQK